ncbi:hypothetical protein PoB_005001100 [Plakobranchus ocellatus]|uniref:Uncharacterized protein n=1 Tax=Plakobranchus ocellatus TaxID=259542 RepID=A0AAV4BWM3_9GAST|nr:hypothetical protein PoB_005001100 [Plakobranchus ocellatus]
MMVMLAVVAVATGDGADSDRDESYGWDSRRLPSLLLTRGLDILRTKKVRRLFDKGDCPTSSIQLQGSGQTYASNPVPPSPLSLPNPWRIVTTIMLTDHQQGKKVKAAEHLLKDSHVTLMADVDIEFSAVIIGRPLGTHILRTRRRSHNGASRIWIMKEDEWGADTLVLQS